MRDLLCGLALLFPALALPLRAESNALWTTPVTPFQIADHVFYVGSKDLASYLVVTPAGNILINANILSSPPQIRASVQKLGFRWGDTKILLNSQAHFDHVAGTAEIARETHAEVMAMEGDADVMQTGAGTDFFAPAPDVVRYPPVAVTRVLHDGSTVTLGGVTLTAHLTPGHTRGCTTWTMRAHLPGEPARTERNLVIVGGTGFWSEYRFVATGGRPASYPGIAADFEHTFAELRALPCDVFLGAHGQYFGLLAKLRRYPTEGPRVFLDPAGYQRYVADAERTFDAALHAQQAAAR